MRFLIFAGTFLINQVIPKQFDLLVVDVEGLEEKVFRGFNLNNWRPKMIIVELIDYHFSFVNHPKRSLHGFGEWSKHLVAQGS